MYIMCRMVRSFTCAGILPSQYMHMSQFAGMGAVGHSYIRAGTCTYTCASMTFCMDTYANTCTYVQVYIVVATYVCAGFPTQCTTVVATWTL